MDAYLQRLQEGIQSATQGMSGEDLLRHPEGKWCAAEILDTSISLTRGLRKRSSVACKQGNRR